MSGPQKGPRPVQMIAGVMAADKALAREAVELFAEPWGGIDLHGEAVPFDQTDYYAPEMGPHLQRWYVSLRQLAAAEDLVRVKQQAWEVEQRYGVAEKRRVNLDPGYLDAAKLVLASFKPGPQKIYLGQGVWADLVLLYQHGAFGPLPWSFPDFRDGSHATFFAAARQRYKALLRHRRTAD